MWCMRERERGGVCGVCVCGESEREGVRVCVCVRERVRGVRCGVCEGERVGEREGGG